MQCPTELLEVAARSADIACRRYPPRADDARQEAVCQVLEAWERLEAPPTYGPAWAEAIGRHAADGVAWNAGVPVSGTAGVRRRLAAWRRAADELPPGASAAEIAERATEMAWERSRNPRKQGLVFSAEEPPRAPRSVPLEPSDGTERPEMASGEDVAADAARRTDAGRDLAQWVRDHPSAAPGVAVLRAAIGEGRATLDAGSQLVPLAPMGDEEAHRLSVAAREVKGAGTRSGRRGARRAPRAQRPDAAPIGGVNPRPLIDADLLGLCREIALSALGRRAVTSDQSITREDIIQELFVEARSILRTHPANRAYLSVCLRRHLGLLPAPGGLGGSAGVERSVRVLYALEQTPEYQAATTAEREIMRRRELQGRHLAMPPAGGLRVGALTADRAPVDPDDDARRNAERRLGELTRRLEAATDEPPEVRRVARDLLDGTLDLEARGAEAGLDLLRRLSAPSDTDDEVA
jgi:hypothetical protein